MCAVPNMAVFCSSLTSWFPGMLLTYFPNDFEMVPVAPIITGITFGFTFHMRCISIVWSLYFRIFLASFLITFLSPEIATSINVHVLFSLSRIIMSGLLLGMVLSVWTCWFHSMVTLLPWSVYTLLLLLLPWFQIHLHKAPFYGRQEYAFTVQASPAGDEYGATTSWHSTRDKDVLQTAVIRYISHMQIDPSWWAVDISSLATVRS
jgi:hypothetical protein